MSGRRWIFTLLAAIPISATGCQVDRGTTRIWNPFVRADKSDVIEDKGLPNTVRRVAEVEGQDLKQSEAPIAENRVKSLLAEGQQALQDNRIADARTAYRKVLEFLPDDATAHHGLAMAADLSEEWAEAEYHYRQALRSRPRDANLLCDIGYSYLLQNRYSEASSYLSQAIQINPNHENAHTNLALLDLRQGNREAARERLTQRCENSARVNQILAVLESQAATRTTATLAATAPTAPQNASFEEIRELARRERIVAEQLRATGNIPADHAAIVAAAGAPVPVHNPGPGNSSEPHTIRQTPNRFAGPGFDSAAALIQPIGGFPSSNPAAGRNPNVAGNPVPYVMPPQFGGSPGSASQTNSVAGIQNMNAAYSNAGIVTDPASLNPMPAQNQTGPQNSMPSQTSMVSQNPTANPQYPERPGQPDFNDNQQIVTTSRFAPPVANAAVNSGGVVAVRPSGFYHPPTQGVSYGQPMGFNQPQMEVASLQSNGRVGPPAGNASYGTTLPGNISGPPAIMMPGQQNPDLQNRLPAPKTVRVELEGLNAGPGSLFPIGQGSGLQDGTLRMGNVSAPGTNSVINGAMYGQPVSTLPSQEWLIQQQQQIQQMNSHPQQFNQNTQGYNDQGSGNPQSSANGLSRPQSGIQNGNTGTTTSPHPGIQSQSASPLGTYENQLRQLDNQYNNTLQQLDRNNSASVPRAQY